MAFGAIMGQTPDLTDYVKKTGDTLTGPLMYDGVPSIGNELVNKNYVDNFREEDNVIAQYKDSYKNDNWVYYKKTVVFDRIFSCLVVQVLYLGYFLFSTISFYLH